MKIIVTGGAGFIGSHLVDKLIENKHQVAVIDDLSRGSEKNLNPKAEFYKIKIQDSEVSFVFKKENPDIVFHLAALINVQESIADPILYAENNISGSLNIFENCKKSNVKKIVFSSSGGAIYIEGAVIPTSEDSIESPFSPYGITKLAAEKYLQYYHKAFDVSFISLRYSNIYGPRQNSEGEGGVIAVFFDKMMKKEQPVISGDGKQTRDFLYVDDAVSANISAMESDKTGIFNISTGKETDINSVFKKIKDMTNSSFSEVYSPVLIKEQKRSCLNYEKAKVELNWQPKTDMDKGLSLLFQYLRKNDV